MFYSGAGFKNVADCKKSVTSRPDPRSKDAGVPVSAPGVDNIGYPAEAPFFRDECLLQIDCFYALEFRESHAPQGKFHAAGAGEEV